ncbi:hypothetical protein C8N24_0645 [Solirubrobacter pauli]|uniref:Uncharacterized protein n=2 Tax=Solirubrobacter pauli TaxID=166793 RepID=A0A660LA42_9ACTN|nr:hypothetical protein C8N24_0645 [Solirubrobacter pauli]
MMRDSVRSSTTLYEHLATLAPAGGGRGETTETKSKETLDHDSEALLEEEPTRHVDTR